VAALTGGAEVSSVGVLMAACAAALDATVEAGGVAAGAGDLPVAAGQRIGRVAVVAEDEVTSPETTLAVAGLTRLCELPPMRIGVAAFALQ